MAANVSTYLDTTKAFECSWLDMTIICECYFFRALLTLSLSIGPRNFLEVRKKKSTSEDRNNNRIINFNYQFFSDKLRSSTILVLFVYFLVESFFLSMINCFFQLTFCIIWTILETDAIKTFLFVCIIDT